MSSLGNLFGANPILVLITCAIVAGAAWTAWSEWTAAASEGAARTIRGRWRDGRIRRSSTRRPSLVVPVVEVIAVGPLGTAAGIEPATRQHLPSSAATSSPPWPHSASPTANSTTGRAPAASASPTPANGSGSRRHITDAELAALAALAAEVAAVDRMQARITSGEFWDEALAAGQAGAA